LKFTLNQKNSFKFLISLKAGQISWKFKKKVKKPPLFLKFHTKFARTAQISSLSLKNPGEVSSARATLIYPRTKKINLRCQETRRSSTNSFNSAEAKRKLSYNRLLYLKFEKISQKFARKTFDRVRLKLFGGFGTFFVLLTFLSVAISVIPNQFPKIKRQLSSFTKIYKKIPKTYTNKLLSRLFCRFL
jgi:hypothetical protein